MEFDSIVDTTNSSNINTIESILYQIIDTILYQIIDTIVDTIIDTTVDTIIDTTVDVDLTNQLIPHHSLWEGFKRCIDCKNNISPCRQCIYNKLIKNT